MANHIPDNTDHIPKSASNITSGINDVSSRNMVPRKPEFTSALLETYPNLEDTNRDPETGAPIPSDFQVADAKRWVEENEL